FGWCAVCRYGPEPTASPLIASSQAPGRENTCFGMTLARVSRASPSGKGNLSTSSTVRASTFLASFSQLTKKHVPRVRVLGPGVPYPIPAVSVRSLPLPPLPVSFVDSGPAEQPASTGGRTAAAPSAPEYFRNDRRRGAGTSWVTSSRTVPPARSGGGGGTTSY